MLAIDQHKKILNSMICNHLSVTWVYYKFQDVFLIRKLSSLVFDRSLPRICTFSLLTQTVFIVNNEIEQHIIIQLLAQVIKCTTRCRFSIRRWSRKNWQLLTNCTTIEILKANTFLFLSLWCPWSSHSRRTGILEGKKGSESTVAPLQNV